VILVETQFDGRSRMITKVSTAMWWVLLPLALAGLWRWRRRRRLMWPVLAVAAAASIVFTTESGTRYRAPLEPLVVVFACAAVPWLAGRDLPSARAGTS
jgi:MYXO-CTERM domain-containing protein